MAFIPHSYDGEYLPHIKWLWVQYQKNKYFRWYRIFSLSFFVIHQCATCSSLVKGNAANDFDIMLVFISIHIFLCEISSNISTSYIQRVQDQMEICFWSIHNLPKKTYSQFFQKIVLIRIVVICFYINMFTSAILAWVYDWHPQWFSNVGYVERVSLMLFYTAAFIGAYIMCYMHVYIAVYFALNMNIQLMILASYFENITDAINESLVRHRISEYVRNQEIISNRLLIGIKQHIAYKRLGNLMKNLHGTPMRAFMCLNGLLAISHLMYYAYKAPTVCSFLIFLNYIAVLAVYAYTGQLLHDGFSEFADMLRDCKIYLWNVNNQKLFLLFIPFAQREVDVKLVAALNLTLNSLLTMLRMIYALTAVAKSLEFKKNVPNT